MKTDKSIGKLGLKLKADIIQEPVPADTICIEAELFQYNRVGKAEDTVIA